MNSLLAAKASLVIAVAMYAALLLGVRRGRRILAILLVVASAAALICTALALPSGTSVARITDRTGLLVVLGIGGLALLAALTWLAWRFPAWTLPVAAAVAPLRLPLSVGGNTVHALVPLYLVIMATLIAEVVLRDRLRPSPQPREPLRTSLAVLIAVVGASSLWAGLDYVSGHAGFAAALVALVAFYPPFGILFALTWRYLTSLVALRRIMLAVVVAGTVLAGIGILQYATRFVILNRATIMREVELGHGFRINSLLWDPNMLSRWFLLAVLFAAALAVVMPRHRRWLLCCAAVTVVADALTFSRSGWIMLVLAGVTFALIMLRGRKMTVIVIAAVLLVGSVAALVAVRDVRVTTGKLSKPWGINKLTGGRYYLSQAGIEMFANYPLSGVGLGAFPLVYDEYRDRHAAPRLKESHTTPVTIMAENGLPGLLAYAAVLLFAALAAVRAVRRSSASEERALAAAAAAALLALFLLSLVYNAFFEDAMVWLLMAALGVLAAGRLRAAPGRSASGGTPAP